MVVVRPSYASLIPAARQAQTWSVCSEQGSDGRDVIRGARIGRDVEDWLVPSLAHVPRRRTSSIAARRRRAPRVPRGRPARAGCGPRADDRCVERWDGPSRPGFATAACARARRPAPTCRRGEAPRYQQYPCRDNHTRSAGTPLCVRRLPPDSSGDRTPRRGFERLGAAPQQVDAGLPRRCATPTCLEAPTPGST